MRAAVAPALALALLSAGAAGGGVSLRPATLSITGAVDSIAADGARVAVRRLVPGDQECHEASIWSPTLRRTSQLRGPACGSGRAYDLRYGGLTLAATRVAWVEYDVGNRPYCAGPFTATLARPRRVSLGQCTGDPDTAGVTWDFAGDRSLLVARSATPCAADCEPDFARTYEDDVTLWRVTSQLTRLRALPDDTRLHAVSDGRILVGDRGGLTVLGRRGGPIWHVESGNVSRAMLDGDMVAAQAGRRLLVYSVSGGTATDLLLPRGARLLDLDSGDALYAAGRTLRLLGLPDGRDRVVATVRGLVDAELEPPGLFYGRNRKGGRVAFLERARLP